MPHRATEPHSMPAKLAARTAPLAFSYLAWLAFSHLAWRLAAEAASNTSVFYHIFTLLILSSLCKLRRSLSLRPRPYASDVSEYLTLAVVNRVAIQQNWYACCLSAVRERVGQQLVFIVGIPKLPARHTERLV
jgi:hypothetical protein